MMEPPPLVLNCTITAWPLSVLVLGEQGAMLACGQFVDAAA